MSALVRLQASVKFELRERIVPEIGVNEVTFAFERETVLRQVSFDVKRGDFVALLGASGCGKSTLLRLMAGLLQPTSGQICVAADTAKSGRPKSSNSRRDSNVEVGFVFQKPTLCPWLTVAQNIELPLSLRGTPTAERRQVARAAVTSVGLAPSDADKYPYQLSGGMKMRVSIARAFVAKPQLMLMDEPFSALDEVLRQQLAETCLDLWESESWTTVFVTHNVAEAVFLCGTIHILAGKPATIVDSIDIPFVERDASLRTSSEFVTLVSDVSQRLRVAVEAANSSTASLAAKGGI